MSRTSGPTRGQLESYLENSTLIVGASTLEDDLQHVYYLYQQEKQFVTLDHTGFNHTNPVSSGQYIIWQESPVGESGQYLVLYDVLSKVRTRLSFAGIASGQVLHGNAVAWEDTSDGRNRVMYYDGTRARVVSGPQPAGHPAITDNKVAFVEYPKNDVCQVVEYDTVTNTRTDLQACRERNAWPRYEGSTLVFDSP